MTGFDGTVGGDRPRVDVAVPRKGRPLEAVLERLANRAGIESLADDVISTLRYEKAIAKGNQEAETTAYDRLAEYSDLERPERPEYTLLRDDRDGMPRRIVFDSLTVPFEGIDLRLIGREEPFRALRTHEFTLGFDSADLVLEEVVSIREEPLERLADLNERIDPRDTDVRVVGGLGDTVHHALLATPDVREPTEPLDRSFLAEYDGEICISPRYERLVTAVIGTETLAGSTFTYPAESREEEAAIADVGVGIYLTVSGSTARDHGLTVGERLFPSETVLMENSGETADSEVERARSLLAGAADGAKLSAAIGQ